MFPPSEIPRLFGLPCGVNYTHAVRDGLLAHFGDDGPELLARTEIYVNTSRMKRNLRDAFDDGTTRLLPRIRLITDLAKDPRYHDIPLPMSPLKLRLELAQLVTSFLEREPDFADRVSVHGLADSLARLLGEMHDEGVSYEDLKNLNVPDISNHWQKALDFIGLVKRFYDDAETTPPISEARLRAVVERKAQNWQTSPPSHPVLVVGSTGSRGTTARFMEVVAKLPQGAVVYPGVDFEMPAEVWDRIATDETRDHPQERVIRMANRLGLSQDDVQPFASTTPPSPPRNALLSLALRPAPVTDQWMRDGPNLPEIAAACADLTLIEAADPRAEAISIALVLRDAAETNRRAALITPDRDLARQVTACLDRWNIDPEDSAGVPLNQTPPGRLFRHVASLFGRSITAADLLVVLKHPLVARSEPDATFGEKTGRGQHLLWTRSLEVFLRRRSSEIVDEAVLSAWASKPRDEGECAARAIWVDWVKGVLFGRESNAERPLSFHLNALIEVVSGLVSGPWSEDSSALWSGLDGRAMQHLIDRMVHDADAGGDMSARVFEDFFRTVLARELSRDPTPRHPNVLIWGTLEARSLDADLVILGGLNDGVWPQHPAADPWFNRELRKAAGLLSPDQMVGLSAHDFEQAFCAREVILSRSVRDAEADTVPSRWLVRVLNLLDGASDESRAARAAMSERGRRWTRMAAELDHPDRLPEQLDRAHRPSPIPPSYAQPKEMPVTAVERLLRDPYAVYAQRILGLRKLSPLNFAGDPRDRGNVLHTMMEVFLTDLPFDLDPKTAQKRLLNAAGTAFDKGGIPPFHRQIWLSHISRISEKLVADELARAAEADAIFPETKGGMRIKSLDFELTAKADRIDQLHDGTFHIYDYKSSPPSPKQIGVFNLQLLYEAVILAEGTFEKVGQGVASGFTYLGLNKDLKSVGDALDGPRIQETLEGLKALLGRHIGGHVGYTGQRAAEKEGFAGDFDHLARLGEWDTSEDPVQEELS
ncbi:double-strand break repair protein AddB [Celeribacter sp.]|uniref:double-strand break repair protein AddB n=1 Tax=Celeribacter sp. TaxID=1890673 RepID=UPI003A94287C